MGGDAGEGDARGTVSLEKASRKRRILSPTGDEVEGQGQGVVCSVGQDVANE